MLCGSAVAISLLLADRLVPRVIAVCPRDFAPKRREQVVERPGDYNVVVGAEEEGDDDRSQSRTCRAREVSTARPTPRMRAALSNHAQFTTTER